MEKVIANYWKTRKNTVHFQKTRKNTVHFFEFLYFTDYKMENPKKHCTQFFVKFLK